jgi:serine/threonine-protein kinase
MAIQRSLSLPGDELTVDASLDGDIPPVALSAAEHTPWFHRIVPKLLRISWIPAALPCLLITVVLLVGGLSGQSSAARGQESSGSAFCQRNLSTLVVGFGCAIYGCLVNRRLQQKIQKQEQLGPYTLHELIGSGGMGDVFLAEHQLLKRKCAVKLIRRDRAANRRMLARFEREVKATAQLTHWNTVQVYDYGCTPGGTFYYAMEYLQGLNLRQLVEEYGPLPPGRVVFILRQLCGALHEAAQYGLVHRDIKPSNIFLAERGQMHDVAKLLDFGLVLPASMGVSPLRNLSRQLQGSPRYMCPEQTMGQKPDCRGDLYSLACVAYYLLSGRPPFEDDNPVMLVVAHSQTPAPRLEEIGVDIPQDLSDIVMKCLSKNPADRFQTPRELQQALENCACLNDWSWSHAERWWQSHPRKSDCPAAEQTNVAMETQPVNGKAVRDCDRTHVCVTRDHSAF